MERKCARIIFFISTISPRENYSGGSRTLLYNEGNGYANRSEETPPRSFRDEETKRRSFQGCLSQIYREPRSMDKLLLRRIVECSARTSRNDRNVATFSVYTRVQNSSSASYLKINFYVFSFFKWRLRCVTCKRIYSVQSAEL